MNNCFVFRGKPCIFVYTEIYRRTKTIDFYYLFYVFSSFFRVGPETAIVRFSWSLTIQLCSSALLIVIYLYTYRCIFLSFLKEIILTMVILFIATAVAMCLPIKENKKKKCSNRIISADPTRRRRVSVLHG